MTRRTLLQRLAAAVAALFVPVALRTEPDPLAVLRHAMQQGALAPADIEGWFDPGAVHRAYETEVAQLTALLHLRVEHGRMTQAQFDRYLPLIKRDLARVRDRQLHLLGY